MTTETGSARSIEEMEEIVAELRQAWARARHAADLVEAEKEEVTRRCDEAWQAVVNAKEEYERCDRALVNRMTDAL